MLDRRSFLAALGAALAGASCNRASAVADRQVYLSACMDLAERGAASIAAFDGDGRLLFATRLPARGHDVTARPGTSEVVVFARRPGNWAAIVDRATGRVLRVVTSPPERHFFGHGTFSGDGRWLYATENRIGAADAHAGEGMLGVYDATAGYARVDERPTHGLGPHDLAMLPGRHGHVLVANGGTRTLPDSGREILNPNAMEPSLAVVDLATGDAVVKSDLGPDLRGLSIRHLAVAADGEAAFACQWEGEPTEAPPLVGLVSPDGRARLLDIPDDDLASLSGYVGSVVLDASERVIAATSPRGGTVAFWERTSGRYLGRSRLADVCGIAPATGDDGFFIVSSGNAGLRAVSSTEPSALRRFGDTSLDTASWDNHILAL